MTFSGTDGLSGVDTCATATYSGPDRRGRLAARHLHRQGGQRQRRPRARPQVRRDGADRHGRRPGARRQRQRLVQPRRRLSRSAAPTQPPGSPAARAPATAAPTMRRRRSSAAAPTTRATRPAVAFALKYDATAPTATGSQAAREPGSRRLVQRPRRGDLQRHRRDLRRRHVRDRRPTPAPTTRPPRCPAPAPTRPATSAPPAGTRSNTTPPHRRHQRDAGPEPNGAGWHNRPVESPVQRRRRGLGAPQLHEAHLYRPRQRGRRR